VSIYWEGDGVTLYHGDCLEHPEWWTGADVLVTDPPYGRRWRQGDSNTARGWRSNKHDGIIGDDSTATRDGALALWGDRAAFMFGDLMLNPPTGTKQVLIYDKGVAAGFAGAVAGFRRNVEAIYLLGSGFRSGLGGRSAVLTTRASAGGNLARTTGHPHTKPIDLLAVLIESAPPGVIADPFAGSGTTLETARLLGRRVIGVEIDERYCEIAASRLAQGILI
jgi:site-specific DNA-methyltransferase (adenine-specific)